ncbi:hypothetical protein [Geotalea toluenoxydans]|uniref:hypothetical protein n=1 Tax=Geotalea toluenoxydans TaxID=421624 RepID=UPI0006CFCDA2|nr:hypothetical protein [Geotalea toluenoxydans]
MSLFSDGWNAFVTDIKDFNDGIEACQAELQATHNVTNNTTSFYGDTKGLHGHAEIDAVWQFLKSINWDVQEFPNYQLTITCKSKPCCQYCAAVLGNLGVFAGKDTYKIKKAMGVSYALPPDVRKFLCKLLHTTEQKVLDELTA